MTGWAVPGFVHVRQVRVDAMGRRVIARHRVNRRIVSITYLSPELLADAEFRNRFAIVSERLTQIRDASVARVHQYVECGDNAAIVADHVEGTSLRVMLLEEGAIDTEAAVVVLKDVLRGIAAGHAAGLVHGDLKPEDVVLTSAGRARLVDFGLSTCAGRRLQARSTPFYLAPEQWSGESATEPGDLYAATVTFFECLVGAPPFHADRSAALFTLHERSAPPLDAVPEPVREVVRSGLTKDPARRPSARGFLAHVEEAAADGLGHGWERRGRRELSRLLTRPSHPADVPVVPVPRGRERNVRLAAVLGGALVLAAGLSSPPLPGVLRPGPGALSEPADRPPVLSFPGPAHGTPAGVSTPVKSPTANRPPDPQSAAMAEPVGPSATAEPDGTAPSAGSRMASPGGVPVNQGVPPGSLPLTPRTNAPPPAEPPVSAPEPEQPPTPAEQEPPAPSEQEPQAPTPPEPEPQEPPEQEPSEQEPSHPSEQEPDIPTPSEPAPSGEQEPTPRVVQATTRPEAEPSPTQQQPVPERKTRPAENAERTAENAERTAGEDGEVTAGSECGAGEGHGDDDIPAARHRSGAHR